MTSKLQLCFLLLSLLFLASSVGHVTAQQQQCPGYGPWRLKCPQYCCLQDFEEPLEGQYCCSSCRYSYDTAVRNSYQCTASHYLHETWAVVLMACGIAFILLVCCTCCCCCCCAPCRDRRSRRRSPYVCCESGKQHQQYQHRYYGSVSAPSVDANQQYLAAPSAPPALSMSSSPSRRQQQRSGKATVSGSWSKRQPWRAATTATNLQTVRINKDTQKNQNSIKTHA